MCFTTHTGSPCHNELTTLRDERSSKQALYEKPIYQPAFMLIMSARY